MSIYRSIRHEARSWWYHERLRDQGRTAEARRQEHRTARGAVRRIRQALDNGGFAKSGRGGHSLHYGRGHQIQGLGPPEQPGELRAAILAGVPYIDTRAIPDLRIGWAALIPMADPGRADPAPWGSLSLAPLPVVARLYQALGARILNLDLRDVQLWPSDLRGGTLDRIGPYLWPTPDPTPETPTHQEELF